jgi:hypothetical protein
MPAIYQAVEQPELIAQAHSNIRAREIDRHWILNCAEEVGG